MQQALQHIQLPNLCAISVSGGDATAFLHGQLTNHVNDLPNLHAQRNSWCTAKGRMLTSFWLTRHDLDGQPAFTIIMSRDIVDASLKRLRMFVLRSKCVFAVRDDLQVSATLNAVPDALVSKAHYPIVQSAQGFELPLNNGISLRVAPAEPNLPANDNAWQLACVNAAEPWITAATVDQFVPQMVNFDVLNGVHFQKGCYPGQEIVHRTKMLGRVRRRAVIATATVQASGAKAGDSVYSKQLGGEQAAGMVIAAAIDGTQSKLLISSMLEGVAANDLSLSSQFETMLTCVNPPYRVAELS